MGNVYIVYFRYNMDKEFEIICNIVKTFIREEDGKGLVDFLNRQLKKENSVLKVIIHQSLKSFKDSFDKIYQHQHGYTNQYSHQSTAIHTHTRTHIVHNTLHQSIFTQITWHTPKHA